MISTWDRLLCARAFHCAFSRRALAAPRPWVPGDRSGTPICQAPFPVAICADRIPSYIAARGPVLRDVSLGHELRTPGAQVCAFPQPQPARPSQRRPRHHQRGRYSRDGGRARLSARRRRTAFVTDGCNHVLHARRQIVANVYTSDGSETRGLPGLLGLTSRVPTARPALRAPRYEPFRSRPALRAPVVSTLKCPNFDDVPRACSPTVSTFPVWAALAERCRQHKRPPITRSAASALPLYPGRGSPLPVRAAVAAAAVPARRKGKPFILPRPDRRL